MSKVVINVIDNFSWNFLERACLIIAGRPLFFLERLQIFTN
jgi:hypothetical protein